MKSLQSSVSYFVLLFFLNCAEGSFRCDYNYSPKARAWFKHFIVPATWYDARLRCTLEGAVLASPTTLEIRAEMRNIINSSNPKHEIFTGVHATFSRGDYHSIEGTPLYEIPLNWAENEPDNKDNKESCITLNGLGKSADRRCEETRPYICYQTKKIRIESSECGTIDPEYNFDKRTNKCYKFHKVPRNFSRAFMACSAEGGHLVIINSEVEAKVLKELFAKYPDSEFVGDFRKDIAMIGVHEMGEQWDFRTINGQTLEEAGYDIYSSGEPHLNPKSDLDGCLGIYRTGLLTEWWSEKPLAFICEKDPIFPGICRDTYPSNS